MKNVKSISVLSFRSELRTTQTQLAAPHLSEKSLVLTGKAELQKTFVPAAEARGQFYLLPARLGSRGGGSWRSRLLGGQTLTRRDASEHRWSGLSGVVALETQFRIVCGVEPRHVLLACSGAVKNRHSVVHLQRAGSAGRVDGVPFNFLNPRSHGGPGGFAGYVQGQSGKRKVTCRCPLPVPATVCARDAVHARTVTWPNGVPLVIAVSDYNRQTR